MNVSGELAKKILLYMENKKIAPISENFGPKQNKNSDPKSTL
jgi:hypothetical protein